MSTARGLIADDLERPAIDRELIARIREIGASSGSALLDELIDLFIEDTPKRLARLEDAIVQGSAPAIAAAAHALTNNAGHFGAQLMAELSSAIEDQALAGRTQFPASVLAELTVECERVQKALRAEKTAR